MHSIIYTKWNKGLDGFKDDVRNYGTIGSAGKKYAQASERSISQ
jgi:hypothetical protein